MITIWHNPRCSKSRQTLALLQERNLDFVVRKYLEDTPSIEELRAVCKKLGMRAIDVMRVKEKPFGDLELANTDAEEILFGAMSTHPILIERPIVIVGDKAALGRPPEQVLTIL